MARLPRFLADQAARSIKPNVDLHVATDPIVSAFGLASRHAQCFCPDELDFSDQTVAAIRIEQHHRCGSDAGQAVRKKQIRGIPHVGTDDRCFTICSDLQPARRCGPLQYVLLAVVVGGIVDCGDAAVLPEFSAAGTVVVAVDEVIDPDRTLAANLYDPAVTAKLSRRLATPRSVDRDGIVSSLLFNLRGPRLCQQATLEQRTSRNCQRQARAGERQAVEVLSSDGSTKQ